jgi:hypothetical protein
VVRVAIIDVLAWWWAMTLPWPDCWFPDGLWLENHVGGELTSSKRMRFTE